MVGNELQGWYEDPFRLHDARYFSAGRPTKLVRDGNVESYDEPPAAGQPASGAAAPEQAASGTLKRAEAGDPNPSGYDVPANVRRGPRAGVLMTVAVIAIAGVVTAVMIAGKSGPATPRISPAAFVIQSARHTMSARTADVTVSGSVSAPVHSGPVSGTGQMDFTSNALWLNTTSRSAGHTVVEKEIAVNGKMYVATIIDGRISKLTGGREWIETPMQLSGSANLGATSPAASLAILEQRGNTVRSLGTKTIDGVTCTGYSVVPSRQALIATLKKEAATLGSGSASLGDALKMIGSMFQPTVTAWFDSQGLLRQLGVHLGMQLQVQSSNSSLDANVVMNFTNYGTPVRVTAPPASDTISYESFLKGLGLGS